MRFHGTLFFIYSPSHYQNSQMSDGLWYKHSPLQKAKRIIRTGNISELRTASVCFIQEEPHNFPCILNGGGRTQFIGACPVTTDCIVAISECENDDNNSNNSSCYSSSSSAEKAASKTLCTSCIYCCILILLLF